MNIHLWVSWLYYWWQLWLMWLNKVSMFQLQTAGGVQGVPGVHWSGRPGHLEALPDTLVIPRASRQPSPGPASRPGELLRESRRGGATWTHWSDASTRNSPSHWPRSLCCFCSSSCRSWTSLTACSRTRSRRSVYSFLRWIDSCASSWSSLCSLVTSAMLSTCIR